MVSVYIKIYFWHHVSSYHVLFLVCCYIAVLCGAATCLSARFKGHPVQWTEWTNKLTPASAHGWMDGWIDGWMNEFCDPAATSAPSIDFGFLLHCCWIMWIVVSLLCWRVILLRGQKSEPAPTSWPTVQDGWMDE